MSEERWLSVEEARGHGGLRLVLTRGVPGPWGELAKGIFHVKGIPFSRVAQRAGEENADLLAWTGHANAPIAVYETEPARAGRLEILWLAERLAPSPSLLPSDPEERAAALGWAELLAGENGFGWSRRLIMIDALAQMPELPEPLAGIRRRLGDRYGYSPEAAALAAGRIVALLRGLVARLEAQRKRGSDFLVGDELSIADLTWASFAALLKPLPHALCPMPETLRQSYDMPTAEIAEEALPILFEHRDRIYERYMELPVRL